MGLGIRTSATCFDAPSWYINWVKLEMLGHRAFDRVSVCWSGGRANEPCFLQRVRNLKFPRGKKGRTTLGADVGIGHQGKPPKCRQLGTLEGRNPKEVWLLSAVVRAHMWVHGHALRYPSPRPLLTPGQDTVRKVHLAHQCVPSRVTQWGTKIWFLRGQDRDRSCGHKHPSPRDPLTPSISHWRGPCFGSFWPTTWFNWIKYPAAPGTKQEVGGGTHPRVFEIQLLYHLLWNSHLTYINSFALMKCPSLTKGALLWLPFSRREIEAQRS